MQGYTDTPVERLEQDIMDVKVYVESLSEFILESGRELLVIDIEDGILLKSKTSFAESNLDEVAGNLRLTGKT